MTVHVAILQLHVRASAKECTHQLAHADHAMDPTINRKGERGEE